MFAENCKTCFTSGARRSSAPAPSRAALGVGAVARAAVTAPCTPTAAAGCAPTRAAVARARPRHARGRVAVRARSRDPKPTRAARATISLYEHTTAHRALRRQGCSAAQARRRRDRHPRLRPAGVQRPHVRHVSLLRRVRRQQDDHAGDVRLRRRLPPLPAARLELTDRARARHEQLPPERAERLQGGPQVGARDDDAPARAARHAASTRTSLGRRRRRRAGVGSLVPPDARLLPRLSRRAHRPRALQLRLARRRHRRRRLERAAGVLRHVAACGTRSAIPEIYNQAMAREWAELAQVARHRYHRPMKFAGVMTTHTSSNHGMKPRDAHRMLVRELAVHRRGNAPARARPRYTNIRSAEYRLASRMRSASAAAFFALSTPTAATGTPGGICAIASSASSPSSTLRLERSGTPITGRSVCAATAPGSAADEAGAADQHPQAALARAARVLGDGVRRRGAPSAPRTRRRRRASSSTSSAACIRSRSDSEPTRIPTSSGMRAMSRAVAACRRNLCARRPSYAAARASATMSPSAVTLRMRPPFVTRRPSLQRRARVEDERAARLRRLDPVDRRARCRRARDSRGRRARRSPPRASTRGSATPASVAGRRRRERLEQVALEQRQERLRLGIAEAAVELEHARAVAR